MKEMFSDSSSLTSCWHAVTYCETAPPHRQPSGREGKNGGMQREEHLVFSELAMTGNVIDGRFTPSQAQIWTYTFVFMGSLAKWSVVMCLWLDYLFVMHNDSPLYM